MVFDLVFLAKVNKANDGRFYWFGFTMGTEPHVAVSSRPGIGALLIDNRRRHFRYMYKIVYICLVSHTHGTPRSYTGDVCGMGWT